MKKNQIISYIVLLLLVFAMGFYISSLKAEAKTYVTNSYDYAFSEVVNNVNNIEAYLAKAMISKGSKHASQTLTKIWNYSSLAIVHLGNIPFDNSGKSQTLKFLNQVSDYSYVLSRKALTDIDLSEEELKNLETLHNYSVDLANTINQLSSELNSGIISWEQLEDEDKFKFTSEENENAFLNIESNFDDYEGLIYDGAYSDYQEKNDKKGLIGDEITENDAKEKAIAIFGKDKIKEIKTTGENVGGDIECYNFSVSLNDKYYIAEISISKKGGWLVEMIRNRDVSKAELSNEEASKIGIDFMRNQGFDNMVETYYLVQDNIVTINYAFEQDGIIMYPDLVKVKIALDNGEVLGLESKGYLNSHVERVWPEEKITIDEARENLNEKLQILSEKKAVIPKEDKTEKYCYEFKGVVDNRNFLVYIDVETGEEEEILVILETEGGTLTI